MRPPRRRSLARRLTLLAAGWSLAVLVVAGLALTAAFQRAVLRPLDASLEEQISNLQAVINVDGAGGVQRPALTDDRLNHAFSGRYWLIYEPDGKAGWRELARSTSLGDFAKLPPPPQGAQAVARKPGVSIHYNVMGPDGQILRMAAQQNLLFGRSAPLILAAAEDRSRVVEDSRRFFILTAATLMILGAGLVLAVLIQVRIGLRPLFALRREVEHVRRGQAERLDGQYPVEVEPLAVELNALLAHNQEVVERQRTHVGNLAHALKTPLSVMLAEAERSKGPLPDLVRRQAEVMRAQVDHHLRRARAAARSGGGGEATPIAPVLDELARTLERIFRAKGVVVDWRCPDDLAFHGERQDLLELAGNVMENAAKWCGSHVRVFAAPLEGESRLVLTVEDDGPGLPPDRRAEVMRRGARLDEDAPGSGLGLNIVDELARAYGGSVTLEDLPLGGLKAVLTLPRA